MENSSKLYFNQLREKAYQGLFSLSFTENQKYVERLEYELGVVEKLGFSPYFLVVLDYIEWARTNGILVGPGRGSVCGSLLAYVLGITRVDPIRHDLYFERFLNPERVAPPDIDTDFSDRDAVISYIKERYGENRVARIGTYNFIRTKSGIRDVCRVLEKPYSYAEELANLVPPARHGLWDSFQDEAEVEPKLLLPEHEEVISIVRELWGVIRSSGGHASGVAIAPQEIASLVPLYSDSPNKPSTEVCQLITQVDYRDLEEIGLLKFDILGLTTLEVISLCLKYIEERTGQSLDIEKIPEDDEATFNLICSGNLDGVFQLGGSESIKQLTVSLSPRTISDLSFISALFRPGPLSTKMASQAGELKAGTIDADYLTPELEPILGETYGIPIYQEQIMRICRDLAGYTMAEADNVRKILGKKQKDKLIEERGKFVSGCIGKGLPKKIADDLFTMFEDFATYLFNKCLDKETPVQTELGPLTIDEIAEKLARGEVLQALSFNPTSEDLFYDEILEVIDNGEQEVFEVCLSNDSTVNCTLEHQFLCADNKKHTLKEILENDLEVLLSTSVEQPNYLLAQTLDKEKARVSSIESLGKKPTRSLHMKGPQHNFVLANGVVSGNSHSLAYSYISYQTAYLKTCYPLEFYTALLAIEEKPEKILLYSRSAKDSEISILPPDINLSNKHHAPEGNSSIRFGLLKIRGVLENEIDALLEERKKSPFKSLEDLAERRVIQARGGKALGLSGALNSLPAQIEGIALHFNESETAEYFGSLISYFRRYDAYKERVANYEITLKKKEQEASDTYFSQIKKWEDATLTYKEKYDKYLENLKEVQVKNKEKELAGKKLVKEPKPPARKPVKPDKTKVSLKKPVKPLFPPAPTPALKSIREKALLQREMLGMYVDIHPMDQAIVPPGVTKIEHLHLLETGREVSVCGVLLSTKLVNTKAKKLMARIRIEDRGGSIEAVLFPHMYAKLETELKEGIVYVISGKLERTTFSGNNEEENVHLQVISNNVTSAETKKEKDWVINYPILIGTLQVYPFSNTSKGGAKQTIIQLPREKIDGVKLEYSKNNS